MKASATISMQRCGERDVVVDRRCQAPFSIRQCQGQMLLASSAAAPVGGDELDLTINVGPNARCAVGSVAAAMVWPGADGAASTMNTRCTVGAGGHLDLRLEPTISVEGSRHHSETVVRLDGDATCRVVEEVVLGRTGQSSGCLDQSLRVERDGRALFHHDEEFGPDVAGALSSVSVGTGRFVVTAVLVGVSAPVPAVRVEAHRAGAVFGVAANVVAAMAVSADRPAGLGLLAELSDLF